MARLSNQEEAIFCLELAKKLLGHEDYHKPSFILPEDTAEELYTKCGHLLSAKIALYGPSPDRDRQCLVVIEHRTSDGETSPHFFVFDKLLLVEFAKQVVREIEPSVEEQILETLKRIERAS